MIDQTEKDISIRLASQEDLGAIQALMKESMQALGEGYYSALQIASCCRYVCVPDLQLFADQTYFVTVMAGTIVGCGGWSFRPTLYAGSSASSPKEERLHPDKDCARIRAMFVSPSQSGKGIGSRILAASEEAAKNTDLKGEL